MKWYDKSIQFQKDILSILKYHRAKDMVNIMKFFPGLSSVDDLAVTLDKENKEMFDKI